MSEDMDTTVAEIERRANQGGDVFECMNARRFLLNAYRSVSRERNHLRDYCERLEAQQSSRLSIPSPLSGEPTGDWTFFTDYDVEMLRNVSRDVHPIFEERTRIRFLADAIAKRLASQSTSPNDSPPAPHEESR